MEEKKLTGYPSIDKPWLKYYAEEAINAPLPECTMYEYILENNKKHLDDVALLYFDRKITYNTLFANIDQTAAAFAQLGVKQGDIVTIQSLSIPQVVYIIYALSKIGAVANLIYATMSASEVQSNLEETGSRFFLVMEPFYNVMKDELANIDLDAVIVMSVQNEMNLLGKAMYGITTKAKRVISAGVVLSWDSFFLMGKNMETPISGSNLDPVIMVYTGGTTGKSKAVVLSNHNMNVGAKQYLQLDFQRHRTLLCVLPPFIAFGLTVTIHMPIAFGVKVALCVSPNPTEISGFVQKYHPEYIICGTAQAEKMVKALENKNIDLSNLSFFGVGGDALSLALEEKVDKFLYKHNSRTKIIQGYAMSETSASTTAAVCKIYKPGTVGIPFVYTTVKIIDPDTDRELPYGEAGEICIHSPCIMKGYYKNEEETKNILHMHVDGKIWVHTGDIGTMDEDGFVTIVGQNKTYDSYIRKQLVS